MDNYYLQRWYIRIVSQLGDWLKTQDLRKLGKIRKVSKHRMIAQCPTQCPYQNESFVNASRKLLKNRNKAFPLCVLFDMKTKVSLKYFVSYCLWKPFFDSKSLQTLSNLFFLTFFGNSKGFRTVFNVKLEQLSGKKS